MPETFNKQKMKYFNYKAILFVIFILANSFLYAQKIIAK